MKRSCRICGAKSERPFCREHRSPSARGYGAAHQQARASLAAQLPVPCGYGCGTILRPGSRWVAAHRIDGDANAGWLASCRTCNERAKA